MRYHYVPTAENRHGLLKKLEYVCLLAENADISISFDRYSDTVVVRAPTYRKMYKNIFIVHESKLIFIAESKSKWEGKFVNDKATGKSFEVVLIEDNDYDFVDIKHRTKNVSSEVV